MATRIARRALGALLLAAGACSGSTEPDANDRVPDVRAYTYSLTTTAFQDVRTFQGTLTITFASPDSIAGYFEGVALRRETSLGFWNVDAYVLYGSIGGGTTVAHRIARRGSALSCEARVIQGTISGGTISTPSSCTLE